MSDDGGVQWHQQLGQQEAFMETNNLKLWESVFTTDPDHVKPITGKDYGGNSPKPYWIVQRLTEEFGPCGIGWGYLIDSERFERFSETDVLHVAKVTFWYQLSGRRGEITQMGQTKASYITSKGALKIDEDAPKKSITDALVKCASYLGFAGDIFSGRWDDSKYVAAARKFYIDKRLVQEIGAERFKELETLSADMLALQEEGREMAAAQLYYKLPSNEEKLAIWGMLNSEEGGSTPESRLRSFIKANKPESEA